VNAELIDRADPNLTMAGEAVYRLDSTG